MEYILDYTKMALNTPNPQKGRQTKGQTDDLGVLSNKENISNKIKK